MAKQKPGRKPIMKKRTSVNVYLEASQKKRLEQEAKQQGVSMGQLVREAVAMVVG